MTTIMCVVVCRTFPNAAFSQPACATMMIADIEKSKNMNNSGSVKVCIEHCGRPSSDRHKISSTDLLTLKITFIHEAALTRQLT